MIKKDMDPTKRTKCEKGTCKINIGTDFKEKSRIDTDPLGSWTGTPRDPHDTPVQDADDL